MNGLLHSRKFLLALSDAVISTVTLVATAKLSPTDVNLFTVVVAMWQPVIVSVILGIAHEDAALKGKPDTPEAVAVPATSLPANVRR